MGNAATTVLDKRHFEQALLVLDRERPSSTDEIRFTRLTQAVCASIALTFIWIAAFRPWHPIAGVIFKAALACYGLSMALFILNLGLAAKLWRAAAARRRLRLIPYLRSFVRARRRQHWPTHLAAYALATLGVLLCVFGGWGVIEEWPLPDGVGFVLTVGPTLFGLACILMYFVAEGRESMAAIADLHATLVNSDRSGEGAVTVPIAAYDEITVIEREQISQDRVRSIAAGRTTDPSAYAVRISREVHSRVSEMIPDEWQAVNHRIQELQSADEAVRGTRPQGDIELVSVPPTSWEIGVRVDHDHREVQLISLRRTPAATETLDITR
jgi:hypothetical protein